MTLLKISFQRQTWTKVRRVWLRRWCPHRPFNRRRIFVGSPLKSSRVWKASKIRACTGDKPFDLLYKKARTKKTHVPSLCCTSRLSINQRLRGKSLAISSCMAAKKNSRTSLYTYTQHILYNVLIMKKKAKAFSFLSDYK